MNDASIVITGLSKKYLGTTSYAIKDISLYVKAGESYGFLGPNGAGKSTTIRTLLNFIQPTAGSATILGADIVKDAVAVKKDIGYLSGEFAIYPKMTGHDYLRYMGALQPATSEAYVKTLIKRFNAEPDKKLGELSRGNKQKFGIIQAFMHQPKVVILDEPSSGLDPLMQEAFYELIAEAKQRGAAIFMSSHILSEVQKTCDRVGIVRDGLLVEERNIAEMVSEASQIFDISFAGKAPITELKKINGAKIVDAKNQNVTLHMHGNLSQLFKVLANYDVTKIDTKILDLDEMFMGFYENKGKK